MNPYAIYFWPRGTLASMPGSDTIFGAVCWGIRLLGLTDVGDLLANFTPPRFAFSTPLPVYRGQKAHLRFYPWPASLKVSPTALSDLARTAAQNDQTLPYKRAVVEMSQRAKQFNKIGYLSEGLFRAVVEGKLSANDLFQRLFPVTPDGDAGRRIELVGPAAVAAEERQRVAPDGPFETWLLQTEAVQHNHIDRVVGGTVEGQLFYDNEIFFKRQAGLWCLLQTEQATLDNLVQPALRYLADTGLGANRTAGKGQFDIEVTPAPPLPNAPNPNGLLMLSRYLPQPGAWPASARPLAYRLETLIPWREKKFSRGVAGQATAPVYKRQVRMLAPGCVVPLQPNGSGIYGRLAEVVPAEGNGHRVWQSGLAIGLPARMEATHD